MKRVVLVACLTLLVAAPTMAATDANSCAAKAKHLNGSEQQAAIKKCLEEASSPSNVKELEQQRKRSACEQNAKNLKGQGVDKNKYVADCMTKNEAASAAAEAGANAPAATPAPARQAAPKAKKATPASKSAKACSQQAAKKGLKGEARKKFIKDCTMQ